MRDYLQKLKAWRHNAALLEAKNIFSNRIKRNRKICKAWQHYTQNLAMYRSHSHNSFFLICTEEFTLRFVGIQEWCSSFTFSSAFLLPENPSVVIAWHWTFEIILVIGGDKSWEKWTCFSPSAQQTSRLREHGMKWKDTESSIPAESRKEHLRSKLWHHHHNSWSQEEECSVLVSREICTRTVFCSTLKEHHTCKLTAVKQVSSSAASKQHDQIF